MKKDKDKSIRIDEETYKGLRARAFKEGRFIKSIIATLFKKQIEREKNNEKI